MRIGLYAHGGSGNHGCEALVRSSMKLLGDHDYTLLSERPEEDVYYGLDKQLQILPTQQNLPAGLGYLAYSAEMRLRREDSVYWRWRYRDFGDKIEGLDLALAIGGDNYCYSGFTERFSILNRKLAQKKIPIILWGCSIDKERLGSMVMDDLRRYCLIVARESSTYDSLKEAGLNHVVFMPDTAFLLDAKDSPLPDGYLTGNMVGLNVSPLTIRQEPKAGSILRNCRRLIDYILQQTDMGVVLIPHVVWPDNDDRLPLTELYEEYASSGRVLMLGDNDAQTIKGIIRRCRFMIAARTHASIAGYSTSVPTVAMGYSVKSRGIAKDLFGTADHYVLPIDQMVEEDELTESFKWLVANEDNIRMLYDSRLMEYMSCLNTAILDGFL